MDSFFVCWLCPCSLPRPCRARVQSLVSVWCAHCYSTFFLNRCDGGYTFIRKSRMLFFIVWRYDFVMSSLPSSSLALSLHQSLSVSVFLSAVYVRLSPAKFFLFILFVVALCVFGVCTFDLKLKWIFLLHRRRRRWWFAWRPGRTSRIEIEERKTTKMLNGILLWRRIEWKEQMQSKMCFLFLFLLFVRDKQTKYRYRSRSPGARARHNATRPPAQTQNGDNKGHAKRIFFFLSVDRCVDKYNSNASHRWPLLHADYIVSDQHEHVMVILYSKSSSGTTTFPQNTRHIYGNWQTVDAVFCFVFFFSFSQRCDKNAHMIGKWHQNVWWRSWFLCVFELPGVQVHRVEMDKMTGEHNFLCVRNRG